MKSVEEDRLHCFVQFRYFPALASLLAFSASAGSELKFQESPSSNVIYLEETGGIISSVVKPLKGNTNPILPGPLQNKILNTPTSRPPGAGMARSADKIRFVKPAVAPIFSNALTNTALMKIDEGLRLDRQFDIDRVVAKIASSATPPAERARRITEAAEPFILLQRNASAALQIGWLWLDGKEPANASRWFQYVQTWYPNDDEALRGLALATLAERHYAAAVTLVDKLPLNKKANADVRSQVWIAIGQREYGLEHYTDAIEAFDRAEAVGELPRYAYLQRSWSRFKLGDKSTAASDFARLYRESPDLESAQGILAAVASGPLPIDTMVASTEPLASLIRLRQGELAFRAHRYLEAAALDPLQWKSLGSPSVIAASGAVGWREKTGTQGLGKMVAAFAPGLGVSAPLGHQSSLSVAADQMRLDAGMRGPDSLVGSAPVGVLLPATFASNRTTVRESKLSLRMEHNIAIVVSASGGVKGGPVNAQPVGSLEVSLSPSWGQVDTKAYAEPVRESILSWAGMVDPHSGSTWGGVRRQGAEARVLYLGSAPYSVGFHMRLESIVGTQVANNRRQALDASIGRDLGLMGFAYTSLSLAASVDSYNRNLSHFTIGHGGYFSPQSYGKAGLAFDFMTSEGKLWLLRGRADAARTWKRENTAPLFPLGPDGRFYDGSRTNGHEASIRLTAVALISPYIQLGLSIGRGVSSQSSDKIALIEMRVLFEPRRGVVSADLPVIRTE